MIPQTKSKTREIAQMQIRECTRFWSHVAQRGPNDCWPWLGGHSNNGYSVFRLGKYVHRAHRISYQLRYGSIPNGKFICHRCDNPGCCNPRHLYAGTQLDNMRDRDEKTRNGTTKLTIPEVLAIRELHRRKCPVSQRRLAKWLGVGQTIVWRIRHKVRWQRILKDI